MKLDKIELLIYEMPTIGMYISNKWLQDKIASYLAWKVNRKWKRYEYRKSLQEQFGKKYKIYLQSKENRL